MPKNKTYHHPSTCFENHRGKITKWLSRDFPGFSFRKSYQGILGKSKKAPSVQMFVQCNDVRGDLSLNIDTTLCRSCCKWEDPFELGSCEVMCKKCESDGCSECPEMVKMLDSLYLEAVPQIREMMKKAAEVAASTAAALGHGTSDHR